MPQLLSLKFSDIEMPKVYAPGALESLAIEEFVVASHGDEEDVAFIAGIEWVSTEQLKLRPNPYPVVTRRATAQEKEAFFTRRAKERKAIGICKTKAREFGLPMKISSVRLDPRETRYIFHFTSEQRVDFRQLVRELAVLLHARIELWQIGVRDEAKMVDGFGLCGLRTCCSAWLPDFRPINLRMAKEQDINLPPVKLSGLCGRLLCCLSYEVDQYKEIGRQLLAKGATIESAGRKGVVMDRNIMLRRYVVQFEDGSFGTIKHDEIGEALIPEQMKRMAKTFSDTGSSGELHVPPAPSDSSTETPVVRIERPQQGPPRRRDGKERHEGREQGRRNRERDPQQQPQRQQSRVEPPSNIPEPVIEHSAEGAPESAEEREAKRRRRRRRGRGRGGSEGQEGAPQNERGENAGTTQESNTDRGTPLPTHEAGEQGDEKRGGRGKRRRSRRGGRRDRQGPSDNQPSEPG